MNAMHLTHTPHVPHASHASHSKGLFGRLLVALPLALSLCVGTWAAPPSAKGKAPADSAAARLADHEARRTLFRQMCSHPTSSQREALEILAKGEGQTLGEEFCADVEYQYFGSQSKPRERDFLGFKPGADIRDISVFQYFTKLKSFPVDPDVKDLSPLINFKSLTSLAIVDNKNLLDIRVLSELKELKNLDLRNTQVLSLEPLAGLSKLETLNLHVEPQTGLPKRTGLDALRHLKNLKDLDIDSAEALDDQIKDLQQLQVLTIYGPVRDVCNLKNLKQLYILYLINAGIKDISCLKEFKELADVNLRGNPIKSVASWAALPKLRNLSIDNTLVEDLSAFAGNRNMSIVEARGTPLRWCSPKSAEDIKKGVSCLNPDGSEKPWWKRLLRM